MSSHHPSARNPDSGEAGYRGNDRQPIGHEATDEIGNPTPEQAATSREVQGRSHRAMNVQTQEATHADANHPGPARADHEKSHGDTHHDGHESEKDMQSKVEKI